ncbi:MAG: metallophosphatase family protein [Coriobacteriia bacterium]|nr:metallophosphatase family protein [Coriobacteriia bacterium]
MSDATDIPARLRRVLVAIPAPVRVGLSLAVALAVGLVAFGGFANHAYQVGPARVIAEVAPTLRGGTAVTVPPFGTISASTHSAPLRLRLTLAEVDLPALQELALAGVPDADLQQQLRGEALGGARRAVWEGLLAAALAAGFVGWSLRHRWRMVAVSALLGVLAPALLLGWSLVTYDLDAFRTPAYRGAVAYAPSLIELVQRRADRVDDLRRQIEKLVRDLNEYYRTPQSFAAAGALPDTVRVLHVSDIHLDPVGLALAREIAAEFDVAFIIDTGDINHYGSDVEATVAASQVPTGWPYVFVPGNHDSPAISAALDALPHVTVIDETSTVEAGVRVFGVADPASRGTGVEPDPGAMLAESRAIAARLQLRIRSGEETPTVVAIHNPGMAEPFAGVVPLVLLGHTHTPDLSERDGTWFLDNGTTGGIHFSDLRPDPHVPHTASVLYFTAEEPRRLIAIDQIEVYGVTGQSSLRRTVIDSALLATAEE